MDARLCIMWVSKGDADGGFYAGRRKVLAMRYLFTVSDIFVIRDRGIVLAPGVSPRQEIRVGDAVELHRPDGTVLISVIKGVEFLDPPNLSKDRSIPILLSNTADEVPLGTKVYFHSMEAIDLEEQTRDLHSDDPES